ncbi:D-alanyl-D-alanine carboxypeptidase/D-alanyl-D-alanine endopeptidase [Sphingopyxis solisilvae]|uniref:D-alanyl-D-alanine carboxypeptidase/D-alanyl-D-alanine endopeptidase n=1 Tax=Sphingopyxis solisilvae TaxID=1886788 RepID=UPI001E35E3A3|nr:D-alanyl-D-alanine carboxypeptidase/D-alanyl-D-alanine-endopeptidase [Sphingopyxis solisilvae]
MTMKFRHIALPSLLALSLSLAPAAARTPDTSSVQTIAEQKLADRPAGSRVGLLVTTMEGETLVSITPDQRFIPASNTKMFTTAIGYAQLPVLESTAKGTGVRIDRSKSAPDVVLHGRGDPRLSSADDCVQNCLQMLADAIARTTRHVRHIIGDDSWLPDERWSPGMSWNNIQSRYGTATSALTLDDNELVVMLTPGAVGTAPRLASSGYYDIENRIVTVAGKDEDVVAERMPNSRTLRLTGTIGADAPAMTLRYGIDDPAHFAAWRLRELLRARGVRVDGNIDVRHRPLTPADDPKQRGTTLFEAPVEPVMLAELTPQPLAENMIRINKESQNLHSELMLRRVARQSGSGSIADGQAVMRRVMTEAGIAETGYDFSDGSGMSTYNRITPRAAVGLLAWIARQPWGAAWRDTLPIAGRDGTLQNRFKGTLLEGKLFAKTGSLNASRALSGYMVTRSGRTLIFSVLANDMPNGTDSQATAAVDRMLVAIAEAL